MEKSGQYSLVKAPTGSYKHLLNTSKSYWYIFSVQGNKTIKQGEIS